MAKAEIHPLLQGLSGTSGGLVFRRRKGQIIIAQRRAPSEKPPSDKQLAQRARFMEAGRYAKEVLSDPLQRRAYEELARRQDRRVDKLVESDYLNPPVVEAIDVSKYHGQPGDLIRVLARDDVQVVSVVVVLTGAGGAVIEQGGAREVHGVWCYAATTALPRGAQVTITATAKDRPGHEGGLKVVYS